jgi:hypothetical protein
MADGAAEVLPVFSIEAFVPCHTKYFTLFLILLVLLISS